MLQSVILDTDVVSRSHKGTLPERLEARIIGRPTLITFITYGELTHWMQVRHWGGRSRQAMADWLAGGAVIPGDEDVAATWGRRLAADAQQGGRRRPQNDMWIAACAPTYNLPLAIKIRRKPGCARQAEP